MKNAVSAAMRIAHQYADGGKIYTGPVNSAVPGRTDRLNVHIPSGSYVLPAEFVSSLGEGNTLAGFKIIESMFGTPKGHDELRASGGRVDLAPAIIAGGEYVLDPTQVAKAGKGDIAKGHDELDKWVKARRKNTIKTLRKLPAPARD